MSNHLLKSDSGNSDSHERARATIALSGFDRLGDGAQSHSEQVWLAEHLESCVPCREFQQNAHDAIHGLRGIPIAASGQLVSTTQMRVRQRAVELQRQQERFWMLCVCCATVALCAAISTAVLWRGFAWIGEQAGLSAPVWESGFVVAYLMPAVLAGIMLLAQGTFLTDRNGSHPE